MRQWWHLEMQRQVNHWQIQSFKSPLLDAYYVQVFVSESLALGIL